MEMKLIVICSLLSIIKFGSICSAYRILGVFPFNAKSHNILFEALMKGLAKHGHQVDVVTHFPLKTPLKNYNEIINLDGTLENLVNNYTIEFVSKITGDVVPLVADTYGNKICHFMGHEKMQKLIKNPPTNPPYDLVITEAFGANCFMGLGYVFNVPVVAVSSAVEYPWVSGFTGNDDNLAYVPNAYLISSGKMNFWERLKNVVINYVERSKFYAITGKSQTESMRKYLRSDMPHIREVEKNVALTFVNSHAVLFGIKPITPALVQIAGLHVEGNDETLSPELKKWMDESTHGVVYFTLGSMVLIETLPVEKVQEIYASFAKISPVRVLMKIANESKLPPGLPKNVKVFPWMPQQPILAHPNTKVFITHGGLGGVQEALYFGVPMIGIPLFSDQFKNVASFVAKQMMIKIDFKKLSEELLDSSLHSLLHNPIYKEKAMYYSRLFRNQPISPMNNAIYWIEYVIQNGADSIKSPALQFTWWQLALLDVYGFIFLSIVFSIILSVLSIKVIITKIMRKLQIHIKNKEKSH